MRSRKELIKALEDTATKGVSVWGGLMMEAVEMLRMDELPKAEQPPFGTIRKAAMAVYTPPFKYQYGYIYDSQNLMIADNGPICDGSSVEGAVASRVRGWGRLGYMPNGAALQDEIGHMMADALNLLYEKELSHG